MKIYGLGALFFMRYINSPIRDFAIWKQHVITKRIFFPRISSISLSMIFKDSKALFSYPQFDKSLYSGTRRKHIMSFRKLPGNKIS